MASGWIDLLLSSRGAPEETQLGNSLHFPEEGAEPWAAEAKAPSVVQSGAGLWLCPSPLSWLLLPFEAQP